MSKVSFRRGTKKYGIQELCEKGYSWTVAYDMLKPEVIAQRRPWIFSTNVDGGRKPKEIASQLIDLKNEIRRTYSFLGRLTDEKLSESDSDEFTSDETESDSSTDDMDTPSDDEDMDTPSDEEILSQSESVTLDSEEEAELPEEDSPLATTKKRIRDDKEFFFSEWQRIKAFCEEREALGEPIDSISMRPILAAKTGIPAGIPARALLASMVIHWREDIREAARVQPYDFVSLSEQFASEYDTADIRERLESRLGSDAASLHPLAAYAVKLAESSIPVMLVGPAGSGKSHIAEQVAAIFDLPYGECPLTGGATPSWLLGSWTIQGFSERPFTGIYKGGGIFNFEEIDAADPNMLLVTNNALAAKRLFNPVNGEKYDKSDEFVPFSTANTFGLGANRSYTGRERMDGATIDRWRMGRIYVPTDEELAHRILFS